MSAPRDKISIGIMSDTHGYLDPFLLEAFAGCVGVIHAGDVGKTAVLEQLEEVVDVYAVRGNIDGQDLRFLPLSRIDEFGGKRIATLHIAGDPQRPRKAARTLIYEERPDVFIAGHTHIPVVGRVQGTLWINPGAAGIEGHHDERFAAILHIAPDGELSLDRIHLGVRGQPRR